MILTGLQDGIRIFVPAIRERWSAIPGIRMADGSEGRGAIKKQNHKEEKEKITMKKMQLKNVTWSMKQKMWRVKNTLLNQHGEGYVDTAVKILIAVVLGALLLAGLDTLFNDTVLPTLTTRVKEMFDYAG